MAIREGEMQTVAGERGANLPEIEIRPLEKGEDATAFRTLNEEWITRYFTLEKMDRETLGTRRRRFSRRADISSWLIRLSGRWLRGTNSHRERCL